jgi:hypothetical protein
MTNEKNGGSRADPRVVGSANGSTETEQSVDCEDAIECYIKDKDMEAGT